MAENSKKNNFDTTVKSLFEGMSGVLSTKTVVGEAVNIDDTIILPLVDVSFGMGAGARSGSEKESGGPCITSLSNICPGYRCWNILQGLDCMTRRLSPF